MLFRMSSMMIGAQAVNSQPPDIFMMVQASSYAWTTQL